MTHLLSAIIGSAITVAALYAWLRFNEWRWERHDAYWDGDDSQMQETRQSED